MLLHSFRRFCDLIGGLKDGNRIASLSGSYSLPVTILDLRQTPLLDPCPVLTAATYLSDLVLGGLFRLSGCPVVPSGLRHIEIANDLNLRVLSRDHLQNLSRLESLTITSCRNFKSIAEDAFALTPLVHILNP